MKPFNYKPDFTHFVSLPFVRKVHRQSMEIIQKSMEERLKKILSYKQMKKNSTMLTHLTLSMLALPNNETCAKAINILQQKKKEFQDQLKHTTLTFSKLGYFTRYNYDTRNQQVKIIYLQVQKDNELDKVRRITDRIIKSMIQKGIVKLQDFKAMHIRHNQQTKMYQNNQFHITLILFDDVVYNQDFKQTFHQLKKHVIPIRLECDFIDISTRFQYDSSGFYSPLARIVLEPSK